jgi:hypothetical protein
MNFLILIYYSIRMKGRVDSRDNEYQKGSYYHRYNKINRAYAHTYLDLTLKQKTTKICNNI